ncbi:MAG: hypothetical protein BWY69_00746 [Planctomycetes bacterium ADurb.Bin401]|nr:MAG: hypothetical protein BWY69_00746 [Planctomycetes bacterium ADurb.Bin401]
MIIENDVGVFTDEKSALEGNAFLRERIYFGQEHFGVNDYAICDHADGVWPDGAAWEKMQREFFIADDDSMAGICAASITYNNIILLGKYINDFPFAFIAPLQTYYTDVHIRSFIKLNLRLKIEE